MVIDGKDMVGAVGGMPGMAIDGKDMVGNQLLAEGMGIPMKLGASTDGGRGVASCCDTSSII
jgi:hypothetical protein